MPLLVESAVGPTISSQPASLGAGTRIALVGLVDFAVTSGVYRSEVRVGDHNFVAEFFKIAGDQLALQWQTRHWL
jgi:hypothetical protein